MKTTRIITFLAILTLPIANSVFAQTENEDAEASANVLEEVIVLATRREETIMEIDMSVQSIPEEVLELPIFSDVSAITALIPGATSFTNKPPYSEGVQLRGSGIIQSGADDGRSPVGYYVDDVPFVDISTPVPPPVGTFDLERIEVIRGPQGTSYGQDSVGGSIIMRTNPVDLEDFGYKVITGISDVKGVDNPGWTIGGVVNIPIAEGSFGLRLSYLHEYDPGYGIVEDRPEIDDPTAYDRDSVRLKLLWDVNDWLDLEFTHSDWDTDYTWLPGTGVLSTITGEMVIVNPTSDMMHAAFKGGIPRNRYDISWTTFLARFDLGWAELTSSTGYVDTPNKETNYEERDPWGSTGVVIFNQPTESFTQQFRLVSTTESPLQWIAGVYYMDAESASGGLVDYPEYDFRGELVDYIDAENWAVFGEVDYQFNEQWSAALGARYQDEERLYTNSETYSEPTDPILGPYTGYATVGNETTAFDAWNYSASLNWKPTEEGLVYLTNSSSNRAPVLITDSTRAQFERVGVEVPESGFDPAKLVNTELGVKWTLFEGTLQLEAAYIYSDWENVPLWIELYIPPEYISLSVGGTDAVINAFEFGLTWAINDYFTFGYGGAFTDTEVTKVPDDDTVVGYPAAVVEGGELFNYSPTTHNFNLNYNQWIGGDWSLFGSINYTTRDKPNGIDLWAYPPQEDYVPARDKFKNVSLSFGANKGPWSLSLSVSNATNERGMFFAGTANRIDGYIGAPRTIAFQVIYNGM